MSTDTIFKENLKINCQEIKDRKTVLCSKPIKINVALTTRCNLSCIMCEPKKIKWDVPKTILDEIIGLFPYLQEIIWQGGEVFLLDYFKELLEESSRHPNLTHEITTSGVLINEEWFAFLNKINLNLNISIDSVVRETYEYIRRGSKFSNLLRVLNLLCESKNKRQDKTLKLVVVVTVMKSNYQQLGMFIDFAKRFKFDRIILQPVKGNYDNDENIFYKNDKKAIAYLSQIVPQIKKSAEEYGIGLKECLPIISFPKEGKPKEVTEDSVITQRQTEELFCYAPWRELFIEWGGSVFPHCLCIQDGPNEERSVGYVLKQTLSMIWNDKKMQLFRKKIVDEDYMNLCNPDCLSGVVSDMRDTPLVRL